MNCGYYSAFLIQLIFNYRGNFMTRINTQVIIQLYMEGQFLMYYVIADMKMMRVQIVAVCFLSYMFIFFYHFCNKLRRYFRDINIEQL